MIYLFSYNVRNDTIISMFLGVEGRVYCASGDCMNGILCVDRKSFDFDAIEIIKLKKVKHIMLNPRTQSDILKLINIKINKIYSNLISEL